MGAEDVPVAEDEAAGDLPDLALGGGDPEPSGRCWASRRRTGRRTATCGTTSGTWTTRSYRRNHLPIGSGVTEAACKTVFSQRLKRSGMAWSVEGGQRIVDLRVIHLVLWGQGG